MAATSTDSEFVSPSQELTQPYTVAIADEKDVDMKTKKRTLEPSIEKRRTKRVKPTTKEIKPVTVDIKLNGTPAPYNFGHKKLFRVRDDGVMTQGGELSEYAHEIPFPQSLKVGNNKTTIGWVATIQKYIDQGRTAKAFTERGCGCSYIIIAFGATVAEERQMQQAEDEEHKRRFESIRQTFFCQRPESFCMQTERINDLLKEAEQLLPDDERLKWIQVKNKALQSAFNMYCKNKNITNF